MAGIDERLTRHPLGLPFLALTAFTGLVVAFLFLPDWLLTELTLFPRWVRIWIATGWVAAAFWAMGYLGWQATRPSENGEDGP